jgi:hypothetical protein
MVDDDLRGSFSSDDDSLFSDFAAPEELGFGEPDRPGSLSMGYEDVRERRPKPRTGALGLTAQQRMILSIFLFLDVSMLGCLCLLGIGAIQPPFMP